MTFELDPKLVKNMTTLAMTSGASFAKTRGFKVPPDDKIDEIHREATALVLAILRRDVPDRAVSDAELATRCSAAGVVATASVLGLTSPPQGAAKN